MDNSILDYDESLNDLERQREQLERVMQTMGEEWEKSGPGINWLKMLQNTKNNSANSRVNSTTATNTITTMDDMDLAPDTSLETNDDLIGLLQQQPQRPSPEYLQSLLHVNETLLAQSLAASPVIDFDTDTTTANITNIITSSSMVIASPETEGSSLDDVCTPGLNSASSVTQSSSTPTTPDDDDNNNNGLHLTKRQEEELDQDMPVDDPSVTPATLCPPDA